MGIKNRDMREMSTPEEREAEAAYDVAWLLGQPPLSKYLDFVRDRTVGGADVPPAALVDEWCAANDYYAELEELEAGFADQGTVTDLDSSLNPLVEEVTADPRFHRTYNMVPTRFGMVELDRLAVAHSIRYQHVERLKTRITRTASPEALFRFCLGLDRDEGSVRVRQIGSNRYTFTSPSRDIRFQEAALLKSEMIDGYETFGTLAAALGLMVGFGSNFFSVIESESRLLVQNGHHRAYALRSLGFTHAPCIIQTVSRFEELELIAARKVLKNPTLYFGSARPPMLKDFFDPRICKVLRAYQSTKVVEVSFEVKTYDTYDSPIQD